MKTIILLLLFFLPIYCMASRTVSGRITDKNDNPIPNARVRAYDSDALSADDLMGEVVTNSNGYYSISYESKHWDTKVPFLTTWRPNIFIRVSVRVNGRCDDGEWNPSANWERIATSSVHSNHRMSDDLTINLKISDYPNDNVITATFTECDNMICSFNFFFHYQCTGCANGKKTEWSDWGTSLPYTATRCINLDEAQNCTQTDLNRITSECNNRILDAVGAESGARALQSNCIGEYCNKLNFIALENKQFIYVVNTSNEPVELNFISKPFLDWKRMRIIHCLNPNDSLLVPSIRYLKLNTKKIRIRNE
jgi:hypothetical protein